jgi:hypothetical protein
MNQPNLQGMALFHQVRPHHFSLVACGLWLEASSPECYKNPKSRSELKND